MEPPSPPSPPVALPPPAPPSPPSADPRFPNVVLTNLPPYPKSPPVSDSPPPSPSTDVLRQYRRIGTKIADLDNQINQLKSQAVAPRNPAELNPIFSPDEMIATLRAKIGVLWDEQHKITQEIEKFDLFTVINLAEYVVIEEAVASRVRVFVDNSCPEVDSRWIRHIVKSEDVQLVSAEDLTVEQLEMSKVRLFDDSSSDQSSSGSGSNKESEESDVTNGAVSPGLPPPPPQQ